MKLAHMYTQTNMMEILVKLVSSLFQEIFVFLLWPNDELFKFKTICWSVIEFSETSLSLSPHKWMCSMLDIKTNVKRCVFTKFVSSVFQFIFLCYCVQLPIQWKWPEILTFFGFFNQIVNIVDLDGIQLVTLFHFIFAGEDAELTAEETKRMGMVDHMIKRLLVRAGWVGFLQALNFKWKNFARYLLKPPGSDGMDNSTVHRPGTISWIDATPANDGYSILLRFCLCVNKHIHPTRVCDEMKWLSWLT